MPVQGHKRKNWQCSIETEIVTVKRGAFPQLNLSLKRNSCTIRNEKEKNLDLKIDRRKNVQYTSAMYMIQQHRITI